MVFKMLQVLQVPMSYYCNCTHLSSDFDKINLIRQKKILFIFKDANDSHLKSRGTTYIACSFLTHFFGYGWNTFTLESSSLQVCESKSKTVTVSTARAFYQYVVSSLTLYMFIKFGRWAGSSKIAQYCCTKPFPMASYAGFRVILQFSSVLLT